MVDKLNNHKKNTGTRLMFGVLVFFGIATLILGVLQITRTINFPGGYNDNTENIQAGTDEVTIEQLMSNDTDGDGLSDFDELYVYYTSMYLADSDSDGDSDKEEIEDGFNPNCPKGQDCRGTVETVEPVGPAEEAVEYLPTETAEQFEGLTASELRQMILESEAMTQEQLDAISDEELMAAYQEILNE